MGKGIVDVGIVNEYLILSALLGSIIWTHLCTQHGLPISVSHALIGGLSVPPIVKAGWRSGLLRLIKVAIFIVLSPLLGLVMAFLLMVVVSWLGGTRHRIRLIGRFRVGQLISSAAYSLGHGTNDAQKTWALLHWFVTLRISWRHVYDLFGLSSLLILRSGLDIPGGWQVYEQWNEANASPSVGGFCAEAASACMLFGTAAAVFL
jgi:PiT family inorganic phosphate transporter